MKRHHAVLNTPTSSGGHIVSASSTRSIDGVALAIEGDRVYCAACKSEGVIRCHGPRLVDSFNGTPFALEHDLCICRCSTPPTLLVAQTTSWQTVDGEAFAASSSASIADPPAKAPFDEQSHLDVEASFAEGLPYHIESGATVLSGRVDGSGHLPRVPTATEGHYRVWVGDDALEKMQGSAA